MMTFPAEIVEKPCADSEVTVQSYINIFILIPITVAIGKKADIILEKKGVFCFDEEMGILTSLLPLMTKTQKIERE